MFFFKNKKSVQKKKVTSTKKLVSSTVKDDRQNILLMIRKIRRRIDPDVLRKAEQIALNQIGEGYSIPPENDARRTRRWRNLTYQQARSALSHFQTPCAGFPW